MWICICSEIRNMQFSVTRFIDRYQWWKYLNIENSAMIVLWKQDCIHPAFVIVVKISILICWNISSNLIIKICMNTNCYYIINDKVKYEQMVFIPLKLYFCCKINFHLSCPLWLFKDKGHKDLFLMSSESLLPTKR